MRLDLLPGGFNGDTLPADFIGDDPPFADLVGDFYPLFSNGEDTFKVLSCSTIVNFILLLRLTIGRSACLIY